MSYDCKAFIAEYPEFGAPLPETAVERQLRQSALMLNPGAWGKWIEMARGLWTAHYLALEYDISAKILELGKHSPYDLGQTINMVANTNGLTQGKAPSLMLTGDNPLLADFGRTDYGLRYLNLLYTVVAPGDVVYSPDTSDTLEGR